MKRSIIFVTIMLFVPIHQTIAQKTLEEAATHYTTKHNNDSIVNKTNKTIIVEVQGSKANGDFLPNGKKADYRSQEDLKQIAQYPDILRTSQFFLKPNEELKFVDSFIKNNPIDKKTGYWAVSSFSITVKDDSKSKPLSTRLGMISGNDVLYPLIQKRQYVVSIINNELQIEVKNTLAP